MQIDALVEEIRAISNQTFVQLTLDYIEAYHYADEKLKYLSGILPDVEYDQRSRKRAQD